MRGAIAVLLAAMAMPCAVPFVAGEAQAQAIDYRGDARALDEIIAANYAYLDRFPDGRAPTSSVLAAKRDGVFTQKALLAYAEAALLALADHHAITGSSFAESWAIVPSYADLWIERDGAAYRVDAVRANSPAAAVGIVAGDRLLAVAGVPTDRAVATFWGELGLSPDGDRGAFAARVLAAGRRDRPRDLTIASLRGGTRRLALPNLYRDMPRRDPVMVRWLPDRAIVTINDALGDDATIAGFDAAMRALPPGLPVTIDLTDTPGGGNTTVARAIMGWFVDRPTAYQVHGLPAEARRTGIARQWIEQVLPRPGKRHRGPVTVRVGRWTGSMGEGLAIGFDAIGAPVTGTRMAGLRGAIYDFRLPSSGLTIKLPAERLMAVDGTPRESYVPQPR